MSTQMSTWMQLSRRLQLAGIGASGSLLQDVGMYFPAFLTQVKTPFLVPVPTDFRTSAFRDPPLSLAGKLQVLFQARKSSQGYRLPWCDWQ